MKSLPAPRAVSARIGLDCGAASAQPPSHSSSSPSKVAASRSAPGCGPLRDGIRGPDVSTGVMLVGAAVLLAWLPGFAGTASGSPARARRRTWPELAVAVSHMTADPLGILRAGL